MQNRIQNHYEEYLEILRELLKINSEFENPDGINQVISFCEKFFKQNLSEYRVFRDEQGNLLAVPNDITPGQALVYLSAHADTVGANAAEWTKPFHPWKAFENETELVARGVNDCKAGVAYQLFLASLLAKGVFSAQNIVFTITFKEEGAGAKTSSAIGAELGVSLPMSAPYTYLFVLENTVSVSSEGVALQAYTAERNSVAIRVHGTVAELQDILLQLVDWNPVSICPIESETLCERGLPSTVLKQAGGHVCSVSRQQNKLTSALLGANPHNIILAGELKNFAVIPTEISLFEADKEIIHQLVMSNRTLKPIDNVLEEVAEISYEELKPIALAGGFKLSEEKLKNIEEVTSEISIANLSSEFTINTGASDATIIYSSAESEAQEKLLPLTIGPGTRSQNWREVPRKTHGVNEIFDKAAGLLAIQYISSCLGAVGALNKD